MMLKYPLIIVLAMALSISKTSFGQTKSVAIKNTQRKFILHLPDGYLAEKTYPVIILLHDYQSNSNDFGFYTGFTSLADKENFILICPEALINENGYHVWNAGETYEEWSGNANDSEFLDSLISLALTSYHGDKNKIFLAGHSNGAMMAYKAAILLSDKIVGLATVSGPMVETRYTPKNPVSIMHIHGDKDLVIPHTGTSEFGLQLRPIDETIKKWMKWDSCSSVPKILRYSSNLTALRWEGKAEIQLILLHNHGHEWPTRDNCGWDATEQIWEFFKTLK